MTVKTLKDLFIHSLSDVYSAEKQLTRALPRLARAATTPESAMRLDTPQSSDSPARLPSD
ncbi:hypothetical protein Hrubri_0539 [Herbaspirillum rubrisubalbicans M1]|nr:hypothetical protein Hrubri_0539 [Herbaspirillum rubrisubalbicans M1]